MNKTLFTLLAAATIMLLHLNPSYADVPGEILLAGKDAQLSKGSARFDLALNSLRDWRAAETVATWRFDLPAKKTFRVMLVYACPAANAGTDAVLQIAGQRIVHLITATGDFNTYKEINGGPILLRKPGTQELTIQLPDKKALHSAWNLRGIRLVPQS